MESINREISVVKPDRPQNKHLAKGRLHGATNKATRLKEQIIEAGGDAARADPRQYFMMLLADEKTEPARRDYAASQLLPYFYSKQPVITKTGNDEPKDNIVINVQFGRNDELAKLGASREDDIICIESKVL